MKRAELQKIVEDYIASLTMPTSPRRLFEPISYSLEGGGKRIRPVLLLASHQLFSDNIASALPAAAAVEVFHNFTLLHDDIMDNAPMRRGRESVYKKWDTNTAILSGDAMVIYAYSMLEKCAPQYLPQVFTAFNKMAMEVCMGQQYDMNFETLDEVSLEEYIRMIELKTAALIARPIAIGAILAGASAQDTEALYRYGVELGTAFQLQDDLLDTYGTTQSLGKSVGGDILEGKKTFLLISALQFASEEVREELSAAIKNNSIAPEKKIDIVKTIYDSLDIAQYARKAIKYHTDIAIESLNCVGVGREKLTLLTTIAQELVGRNK